MTIDHKYAWGHAGIVAILFRRKEPDDGDSVGLLEGGAYIRFSKECYFKEFKEAFSDKEMFNRVIRVGQAEKETDIPNRWNWGRLEYGKPRYFDRCWTIPTK